MWGNAEGVLQGTPAGELVVQSTGFANNRIHKANDAPRKTNERLHGTNYAPPEANDLPFGAIDPTALANLPSARTNDPHADADGADPRDLDVSLALVAFHCGKCSLYGGVSFKIAFVPSEQPTWQTTEPFASN